MVTPLPLIAVAIGLSTALPAQAPSPDNAGYGSRYREVELDGLTGNVLHLGTAIDPGLGHMFVSATGPGGAPPHVVYEFDGAGTLLGQFPQPQVHNATAFGIRDMAHDGVSLIGGSEAGISVFSSTGQLVNAVQGSAGAIPIVQPIGGAALQQISVFRAVAFDPAGDGGRGSLFVADFASPILEIDLSGNVLATIQNGGWTIFGLAYVPALDALWVSADQNGELVEVKRATGVPTGRRLPRSGPPGSSAGGLAVASSSSGHHERWESDLLLGVVRQGPPGPDRLAIQRVDLFPGVPGDTEPLLVGGVQGQPLLRQHVTFARTDTIEFKVDPGVGPGAGLPAWTTLNFFLDAERDAYTDMGPFVRGAGFLPEFRSLSSISVPSTVTSLLAPHAIDAVIQITVPPTLPLQDGQLLRLQSLYLQPASPVIFAATNELNLVVDNGERGIVVAAAGPNSFQSDPTRSFWSIASDSSHSHGAILSVEFSFVGAPGNAGLLRFDLDQAGMNDRFDGGNATQAGCRGTYRNGSDVACGLDYLAAGAYVNPACHTLQGQSGGFVAALVPGFTADANMITFDFRAFTAGKVFAFDCDTDGGLPSGDAHAGMQVRLETARSGTLVGTLQVDPLQRDRAVVYFP